MKKITLALVLLLSIGLVAVSAQELTATVSGSATATIGFDIDASAFGMVNSAVSDVSLVLASGSAATEAADGWYGMVSLASFKIALDYAGGADFATAVTGDEVDGDTDAIVDDNIVLTLADSGVIVTAPTVTAKITDGTTYVQIYALDGFATGFATEVENDGSDISVEGADTDIAIDLAGGTGGFTFGTVVGPATIKVFFATLTGYDGADSADNGKFYVGSDITLDFSPASVSIEVVRGIGTEETLGLSAKTSVAAGPATIGIAFDSSYATAFAWEARADIDLAFGDYGVGVDVFYATSDIDVEVSTAPAFGPVALKVLFGLYDLTSVGGINWGVDLGATFTVNDMMKATLDTAYDSAGVIPVTLKFIVTNPIPNVTITAGWVTADIAAATANMGDFSVATKISY